MKKNVWILNHYATNMYLDKAGRHYYFAENLINMGYTPTIFCASTIHNSTESIDTGEKKHLVRITNRVPFVFIKTPNYGDNGKQRILNMVTFYINLMRVAKDYAEKNGRPDVILASSVHPFTLVAGIRIAKKFGIECICEVRDLWPESLIAYGSLKRTSLFTRLLYQGEKWIYKKADKLIFTMEGGKDYIIDRGWHKDGKGSIDLNKVHHINNGVDLEAFDYNKKNYILDDYDLKRQDTFKVVYAGSIRKVNNVRKIVEVAKVLKEKNRMEIQFLIFGDGPEKLELEQHCIDHNLSNVKFKGQVDKGEIPYILSVSNLNYIHFEQNDIKKYGASLNKMFEYFASGKPTISDCEFGYDLVKKYNSGIVLDNANANQIAEGILEIRNMPADKYEIYSRNAIEAAKNYDFKKLTLDLIELIEK